MTPDFNVRLLTVRSTAGRTALVLAIAVGALGTARDAAAQLDPLLFLKRTKPNVLLVVDTSERMQLDANGNSTAPAGSRLSVARTALKEEVKDLVDSNGKVLYSNARVVRFGLIPMRQVSPPSTSSGGIVSANMPGASAATIRTALDALTAAATDAAYTVDAPVNTMLLDAKTEAGTLSTTDAECRNTVVVLVVGGGEVIFPPEIAADKAAQLATTATQFLNIGSNHRVPIHVIGLGPYDAQLQAIATNSGGVYTWIIQSAIDAAAGQPVPEFVRAVNIAVQHAFANPADVDTPPTALLPTGRYTEHQATSPIVGTVDLEGARDITGAPLINDVIKDPVTNVKIPLRSNLLVTSGFTLPGFDGRLRGFRVYRPEADASKPHGFKFVADGTRLWEGCAPGTTRILAPSSPCSSFPDTSSRNIYTALPRADGTVSVIKFDLANLADLTPYLNTTDPTTLIKFVRDQPLGAIVDSTPAVMDAPSLDPPPDTDYPAFVDANKDRRSIIWIGANDGMLHAIDSRLGVEVWAFIPFNLLPKLIALRSGQAVGDFRFFVDGSPKVADVKIDGAWRTYLTMGEGPGGTFYQSFDVTLANIANTVSTPSSIATVLSYFASPSSVTFNWAFPKYSSFDVSIAPYGDIAATATANNSIEKTVGETWSDPAVGQIKNTSGPYAVLTGSGFLKYSVQQQANRGGKIAGTTFYVLDAKTGVVLASKDVGSDTRGETIDNCAVLPAAPPQFPGDCTFLKNALQADPVATGPADSRFITKAYIGDLDGKIWRFDIGLNSSFAPTVAVGVKMFDSQGQPNFASMATVNVGGTQQYLFQGTGSDLFPSVGVTQIYKLAVVLDNGAAGSNTASISLDRTDNVGIDEKVTGFPAVAGDIVFFTTTSFQPTAPCSLPDANLYAFTFKGGPAYDTNNDGAFTKEDSVKVKTVTGARASAPFIVDQHLVFAAGDKIELFGDPADFNNGVGQGAVRILSWRDVR